jgi:hypothetical protein
MRFTRSLSNRRRHFRRAMEENQSAQRIAVAGGILLQLILPLFMLFGLGSVAFAAVSHGVSLHHFPTVFPLAGMIKERREELSTTISLNAAQEFTYGQSGVPRDLPLTRLMITVEGRWSVASQTAGGTVLPEAPVSLVRNITLKGTKVTGGGSTTLVNCSGEELYMFTNFYEQYDALGFRRKTSKVPGTVFPAAGATTAVGNYDFRFNIIVPIAPRFATHEDEIAGILDPAIFSQLDLVIKWGDTTCVFSGGTAVVSSLTAYGSASGSPTAILSRFSPLAAGLPINQFHYTYLSKQVNMGAQAASATDQLLLNLNVGNKIRAILLRQYNEGTQSKLMATAREGDGSQIGIYRWRVKINGAEKLRARNVDLREMNAAQAGYRADFDSGYTFIDWADRGFLEDIFDTRGFGATATRFELNADWTGETSTDRLDVLHVEQMPVEV